MSATVNSSLNEMTSNADGTFTADRPEDNSGEGGNIVIPVVATSAVLLFAAMLFTGVWLYRRKTGQWPKVFRRSNSSTNHNPAERQANGHLKINTHMADYREPVLYDNKNVNSISESISEHFSETSKNANREHHTQASASTFYSNDFVAIQNEQVKQSLPWKQNSFTGEVHTKCAPPKNFHRTFRAKKKMAVLGDPSRRSSFTSFYSLKTTVDPSLQRLRRHSSCKTVRHSNCESDSDGKKCKAAGKTIESQFNPKNKPCHAGIEATLLQRKDWQVQRNTLNPQRQILEGNSMLQENAVTVENQNKVSEYGKMIDNAPHTDDVSFVVFQSKLSQVEVISDLRTSRGKVEQQALYDERTESQQNTMRPETFYEYMNGKIPEEESSEVEGQSSDTESMAGSNYSIDTDNLKTTPSKRRRHYSEGEFKAFSGVGRKPIRSRKPCKRTCSDGWDTEPVKINTRKYKRNRKQRQRHQHQNTESKSSKTTKINHFINLDKKKEIKVESEFLNTVKSHKNRKEIIDNFNESIDFTFCPSASLKSPIGGTVLEMPIYSQATWSGSELKGQKAIKHRPKIWEQRPHSENISKPKRTHPRNNNKRHTKPDRTLSIGGDGRYFCDYGSLPVDLSKLPKSLVAKLGGRPDKLLEPIEKLNFEQLCRPLPTIGKTEGEMSARRLMAEKLELPPDHSDREILSNTYEYEDTGLVMTDL